ncbi:hypothetical protein CapIbe_000025 [Capra ibex]
MPLNDSFCFISITWLTWEPVRTAGPRAHLGPKETAVAVVLWIVILNSQAHTGRESTVVPGADLDDLEQALMTYMGRASADFFLRHDRVLGQRGGIPAAPGGHLNQASLYTASPSRTPP